MKNKIVFLMVFFCFEFLNASNDLNNINLSPDSKIISVDDKLADFYKVEIFNNLEKYVSLLSEDILIAANDDEDKNKKKEKKNSSNSSGSSGSGSAGGSHPANVGKWAVGPEFGGGAIGALGRWGWFGGLPWTWITVDLHIPGEPLGISMLGFSFTTWGWGWASFGLRAYMDWYFLFDENVGAEWFEIYIGLGVDMHLWFPTIGLGAALRIPIGFTFWPLDWIEPYIQFTPKVGFALHHYKGGWNYGYNSSTGFWFVFDIDVTIGLRFWF